jgi:hypothetical protein
MILYLRKQDIQVPVIQFHRPLVLADLLEVDVASSTVARAALRGGGGSFPKFSTLNGILQLPCLHNAHNCPFPCSLPVGVLSIATQPILTFACKGTRFPERNYLLPCTS